MERRPVFTMLPLMPSPKIADDPGAPFRTVSTQTGSDIFHQVPFLLQKGRRRREMRKLAEEGSSDPEMATAAGRRRSMVSSTIRIPPEADYGEWA